MNSLFGYVDLFNRIVRQQYILILLTSAIALALGGAYISITPPKYTARTAIIIDRDKAEVRLGGVVSETPVDLLGVDSQIHLMKSETVALAVVERLDLATDPEFVGNQPGVSGLIQKVRSKLQSGPDAPQDQVGVALSNLAMRIKISRAGYVVDIEAWSLNPDRAAEIANAVAECYIAEQQRFKNETSRQAGKWLEDRVKDLRAKSLEADEAVVQFKAKHRIIAAGGRLVDEQQITELNSQLIMSREQTAQARARLDRIHTILDSTAHDPSSNATVADTLNNPVIVKLRMQYLDYANRAAEFSRKYGKDHLAVLNVERQLKEVRGSIDAEVRRIAETYKSDYEIAKQKQIEVENSIGVAISRSQQTNEASIALRQLEASAEAYRTLYTSSVQRVAELMEKQSYPGSDARVISRASPPGQASGPKRSILLLGSALGGMMLGFCAGALRESIYRGFRTPTEVETILDAKCLALLPELKPIGKRSKTVSGSRIVPPNASVAWTIVQYPQSRFAEALRSIRAAAQMSKVEQPIKVLGFTSSLPNEGKSTIASAYAFLMAQAGLRTVLVDCDLRHPMLSSVLAPGAKAGVQEVLSGKISLEEAVWMDPTTKLTFLPSLRKSDMAHSSDFLASPHMRALIERLRGQYDSVVLDFSPVAPVADLRTSRGLVDAYVFVVEWARTKVDVAEIALRETEVVRDSLLGIVLNKIDFKVLGRIEGGRRDYYDNKYYARYWGANERGA